MNHEGSSLLTEDEVVATASGAEELEDSEQDSPNDMRRMVKRERRLATGEEDEDQDAPSVPLQWASGGVARLVEGLVAEILREGVTEALSRKSTMGTCPSKCVAFSIDESTKTTNRQGRRETESASSSDSTDLFVDERSIGASKENDDPAPTSARRAKLRGHPEAHLHRELIWNGLDRTVVHDNIKEMTPTRGAERPVLYSENSGGGGSLTLRARGRATNHLTVDTLVTVRAQLLTWDDALIGWLPLEGGGLCNISLLQQVTCQQSLNPTQSQPFKRSSWSAVPSQNTLSMPTMTGRVAPLWEYHIQGKRISDQKVVLNCPLLPHFTYRAALPTFHHWKVEERKYGLSFESAFDASKFHNRCQKALDHLSRQSKSSSGESNLDASDDLEDDVFAPVDFPDLCMYAPRTGSGLLPTPKSNLCLNFADPDTQEAPNLQYPIPTITTTLSISPLGGLGGEQSFDTLPSTLTADGVFLPLESVSPPSSATDEKPPMDPDSARDMNFAALADDTKADMPSASASEHYVNLQTGDPLSTPSFSTSPDKCSLGKASNSSPLHQLLARRPRDEDACSSFTSSSKGEQKECSSTKSLLSSSRSELPFTCIYQKRTSIANEKLRSASNPGTGRFIPRGNYTAAERYTPAPGNGGVMSKSCSLVDTHFRAIYNTPPPREVIPLPTKRKTPRMSEMMRRERCLYCRSWYSVRENERGACREAPDPVDQFIRGISCVRCADAALYHFCKEEGEGPGSFAHVTEESPICCFGSGASRRRRLKRGLVLGLLALFVPCICCYPPLKALQKCFCLPKRGRHKPSPESSESDTLMHSSGGGGTSHARTSRNVSRLSF